MTPGRTIAEDRHRRIHQFGRRIHALTAAWNGGPTSRPTAQASPAPWQGRYVRAGSFTGRSQACRAGVEARRSPMPRALRHCRRARPGLISAEGPTQSSTPQPPTSRRRQRPFSDRAQAAMWCPGGTSLDRAATGPVCSLVRRQSGAWGLSRGIAPGWWRRDRVGVVSRSASLSYRRACSERSADRSAHDSSCC